MTDGWQDISTAPVGKWFLGYVPLEWHMLVLAYKSDLGVILGPGLQPLHFPVFLWHPLPERPDLTVSPQ